MAQDGPKMGPRWPQDGQGWPQDGYERLDDRIYGLKISLKPQDGPTMAQDGPRRLRSPFFAEGPREALVLGNAMWSGFGGDGPPEENF